MAILGVEKLAVDLGIEIGVGGVRVGNIVNIAGEKIGGNGATTRVERHARGRADFSRPVDDIDGVTVEIEEGGGGEVREEGFMRRYGLLESGKAIGLD